MKKIAVILFIMLISPSMVYASDIGRYQLVVHGGLLFKIDTQTGSVQMLLPSMGVFVDVLESSVSDRDEYQKSYGSIAKVIGANSALQLVESD